MAQQKLMAEKKDRLKDRFLEGAGDRIMRALKAQKGQNRMVFGRDFDARGQDSLKVFTIKIIEPHPPMISRLLGLEKELTNWVGLKGDTSIRVARDGPDVLIEIPKPPPLCDDLTVKRMLSLGGFKAGSRVTLGLDTYGDPLSIDFAEPAIGHPLVAGETQSGKSNLLKLICWQISHGMVNDGAQMIAVDVAKKGRHLGYFNNAQVMANPVITDQNQARAAVRWVATQVKKRANQNLVENPPLFLVIDELVKLLREEPKESDMRPLLEDISNLGVEYNIHLILAAQKPSSREIGPQLNANLNVRACGRVETAGIATNILGIKKSGAERLAGYGDFLVRILGDVTRIAVVKMTPRDFDTIPRATNISRLPLAVAVEETAGIDRIPSTIVRETERRGRKQKCATADEIGYALYHPKGINSLASDLTTGSSRAKMIREIAYRIRRTIEAAGELPDISLYK